MYWKHMEVCVGGFYLKHEVGGSLIKIKGKRIKGSCILAV